MRARPNCPETTPPFIKTGISKRTCAQHVVHSRITSVHFNESPRLLTDDKNHMHESLRRENPPKLVCIG
jgi:hypothetical protein